MQTDTNDHFFSKKGYEPLASRMRPVSFDEYVGQEKILGRGKLLRRSIEADQISSIILWGPPGSGKTTLAHVIAKRTRSLFLTLNAVLSGVKDIRKAIETAKGSLQTSGQRSILFIDEVHRFNKAQQDALLPHVENGTIILIGATTENPYFEVNKPLVSRSRIFELKTLTQDSIKKILKHALTDKERGYGGRTIAISGDALSHISDVAQGDARSALNALELAVETTSPDPQGTIQIDIDVAEESIQRRALLYDKDGDVHYDTISAFIKSLRGSDPDAALYWLARMLYSGEDPRFIARRLVIFASEDVGMADPLALQVATAAAHAVEYVGMPECQFNLSQACIHLATSEKSNSTMAYFDALKCVEKQGIVDVPDHLKDANRDKKGLGHGKGYKYPHAHREHWVPQQYLPDRLEGNYFYHPTGQGCEAKVQKRMASLREKQHDHTTGRITGTQNRHSTPWEAWQKKFHGAKKIKQRNLLLQQVHLQKDDKVLDIGTNGLFAWGALQDIPLGKATCIFSDAARFNEFRQKQKHFRVDRIIDGFVETTFPPPLEKATASVVFSRNPLSQCDEFASFFQAVYKTLQPGGRVCFIESLPSRRKRLWQEVNLEELPEPLLEKVIEAEESLYRNNEGIFGLDETRISTLLTENGFEILSLDLRDEEQIFTITPAFLNILFESSSGSKPPSYGDRLRNALTPPEFETVTRLVARKLDNRTLKRPEVNMYTTAQRRG